MKAKLIKVDNGWVLMIDNIMYATDNDKLSLKNCQAIERGWDLIEEMCKLVDKKAEQSNTIDLNAYGQGCLDAFQKALELMGDKKFSKQDMINFSEFVSGKYINQYKFLRDKSLKGFFSTDEILKEYQSLQQTEWDVKIEMGGYRLNDDGEKIGFPSYELPKLDADGCLILKRSKSE